jgi:TolB-like protein
VSAASSKAAAHSEQADARAIGRALDADVLVEGALRRQGGQLAVMLQLIDAGDGLSFWTGRYECDPSLWDEGMLEHIAAEVRAALERHRST